jgi:L-lactate dehydrogenase (cytochrome)
MSKRQLLRWHDLRSMMRLRTPAWGSASRAEDVAALRELARRRAPTAVFDFVDGAAEAETTAAANRSALGSVRLVPRVLRDVTEVSTSTRVLGREAALPFGIAPTGFPALSHRDAELGLSEAAERFGIPFSLSTMGTRSIEQIAEHRPGARRWFQLYLWRDRARSRALVERAREAGYDALIVTVDAPVAGLRTRDVRNGFTMPPELTPRTALGIARRPRWLFDLLTSPPLSFAMFSFDTADLETLGNALIDPSATFAEVAWLQEVWDGPIVVKGVLDPEDARVLSSMGVDAVVVSNHGGRQLDQAVATLDALPAIKAAVGPRTEVWLDSGIRRGSDVAVALASGADFVLAGRAFIYGLMAGGGAGAARAAEILATELRRSMALLGARSIEELRTGSFRAALTKPEVPVTL